MLFYTLYCLYSLYWQIENCLRNLLCLPEHHFYILCEHFWLFLPDRKLGEQHAGNALGWNRSQTLAVFFGIWVTYAHMLM